MPKTVTTARIHLRSVVLAGLLLTPAIAASGIDMRDPHAHHFISKRHASRRRFIATRMRTNPCIDII